MRPPRACASRPRCATGSAGALLLPTVGWPPGTKLVARPDFAWRADAVQDERPDAERPEFARPGALPTSTRATSPARTAKIAKQHAALLDKFRLARGVLTQSNFGLVRFELDADGGVIACQDLYTNPPGKHEGVHVNTTASRSTASATSARSSPSSPADED